MNRSRKPRGEALEDGGTSRVGCRALDQTARDISMMASARVLFSSEVPACMLRSEVDDIHGQSHVEEEEQVRTTQMKLSGT